MVEKRAPNVHKGDLIDARAANLRANLAKRKLGRKQGHQQVATTKPLKDDNK